MCGSFRGLSIMAVVGGGAGGEGPSPRWYPRNAVFLAGIGAVILLAGAVAIVKGADGYRGVLGVGYWAILAALAVGDARTRRAPNRIVYPALLLGVAASLPLGPTGAIEVLLGGAVAFGVMLVVALLGRGAMGYGDVKVGALCGLAVGLHGVVPMLVLTALSSAALAALLLVFRIRKRRDSLPFVPFLAGSTGLVMIVYPLYLWS